MANFSDNERKELLEVPVTDVLRVFGKSLDHSGNGLYYSPFRDEKSPSFHISRDGSLWYDFGTGKGGTVLTLVCQLLGCSGRKGYDFLASVSRTFIQDYSRGKKIKDQTALARPKIKILETLLPFEDYTLVQYAGSRGISPETLETYCREVMFSYDNHRGYRNSAIGFLNNSGGWVLRAPDVKKCTGNDITTLDIYGETGDNVTSTVGLMFEGFLDFLSYMEISGREWPECDVCILNSVTNIGKAREWISEHREIRTLFDNDDAGRKAHEEVRRFDNSVKVYDWSHLYKGHKDLNEALTGSASGRETLTTQYQSLWNKTFQKTFRKD